MAQYQILLEDRQGNFKINRDFMWLTEKEAEKICEQWGWFYDDGTRYSMEIREMADNVKTYDFYLESQFSIVEKVLTALGILHADGYAPDKNGMTSHKLTLQVEKRESLADLDKLLGYALKIAEQENVNDK